MNHVEGRAGLCTLAHQLGGSPRKYGESTGVVGVILSPLTIDARPIVKTRSVEQQELHTRAETAIVDRNLQRLSGQRKCERCEPPRDQKPALLERRKARHRHGDSMPKLAQSLAECGGDVRQTSYFGERRELGGH